MRKLATGAVLTMGLLLAGCSTTVEGTPVADPSGLPKPEVGNFATTPRTVAPLTDVQAIAAEGYRMVATIPLPPDVDPSMRYNGRITTGPLSASTTSTFGEGVATALAGAEVTAYISASDKKPGSDPSDYGKTLVMGLYRMKDDAAARAVVANPSLTAAEKNIFNDAEPPKVPVSVPGYSEAKATTKTRESIKTVSTTAVLASGRFVLVAYTTGPIGLVQRFFDQQIKGLEGFTPTPADRFATLPKDHDDLLTYTISATGNRDVTLPARAAVVNQTDIAASRKTFEEAGVDYVARGDSLVYRAKDASGATMMAGRFIDEVRGFNSRATESAVKGVPGGRCVTYPQYSDPKVTETYCVVPVGRYLAEVADVQKTQAEQALGASYLILEGAK